MEHLDQVLSEIRYPLETGTSAVPFEALFRCHERASGGGRQRIYHAMRESLKIIPSISEAERGGIQERLEAIVESDEFLEEERRDVLERLLRVAPAPHELNPGSVLILLESIAPFQGRTFGAVQPLVVGVEYWGRRIPRLLHDVDWEAMQAGFEPAIYATRDYLQRRMQGGLDLAIRLAELVVTGRFPRLRGRVEGYSLGLGSAIALLSRLLDLPVPADIAFTGRVELDGTVGPVSGCPAKAEAARQKGLRLVFVPKDNRSEFGEEKGIERCGVRTLDEAVRAVFDSTKFDQALEVFRARALPTELRRRQPRGPDIRSTAAPRVLLSCIGDADPTGTPRTPRGEPPTPESGAILTLCTELHPDQVYLFYIAEGREDREERIRAIGDFLEKELRQPRPIPIFLDTNDPTDFNRLLPALRDAVIGLVRTSDHEDTEYYINVTSGTQQMTLTWFLLYERGYIPQGRLYQVRTTQQAQGEPRVREVMLPVL